MGPEFSQLNYVNVGPHGTFRRSGNLKSDPEQINTLFRHLTDTEAQKLVLYFHGGLVREGKGLEIAKKMHNVFKDQAHPVTFVWETGLAETVAKNLNTIHQTQLFQKILRFILRQATKWLGGALAGKGPGEGLTIEEIETELKKAAAFQALDAGARGAAGNITPEDLPALQDEMQVELEVDLEADPDLEEIIRQEVPVTKELNRDLAQELQSQAAKGIISFAFLAKKLAAVVIQVARRFLQHRDHGFYPTVMEEILRALYLADFGAWVWGGMKETAEIMWQHNDLPLNDDSRVGAYFLEQLAAWRQARPGAVVDLVGHSAGSIAVCHLLKNAAERHPGLTFRNLIFLAPACTIQLFAEQVVSHPARFSNFRMFTMADDLEIKDQLVPLVYPRSLLYLVSGILEKEADEPLAGLEVHTRGASPYDSKTLRDVNWFLRDPRKNRLVLSIASGGSGLNSASIRHGDFDDDKQTQDSLQKIIAG
jgi:hypothetical protein